MVPDRDTFFLADSSDLDTVAKLAGLVQRQLEKGERVISALPFVLREGQWRVYEPPESIRPLFFNVALLYRSNNWSNYQAVLEKELAAGGQNVLVASMTIQQQEGVETNFSSTVWPKGVDTILPRVERIFFFESDSVPLRMAAWEDVTRVLGSELIPEQGLPERYRVRSFPTAEQMAAMGARVI